MTLCLLFFLSNENLSDGQANPGLHISNIFEIIFEGNKSSLQGHLRGKQAGRVPIKVLNRTGQMALHPSVPPTRAKISSHVPAGQTLDCETAELNRHGPQEQV